MQSSTQTLLLGRTALVTGGGRGIGAAIARQLVACGASVTIAGRSVSALKDSADALGCGYVMLDLSDAASVESAFASRTSLDILVNNAGAVKTAPFQKVSNADWDATLAVNLTGAFLCCKAAVGTMTKRGFGRIVNIASTGGLAPYAYAAPYIAAKHGLIGLTRALALELARTGVTVNAVCPGYTDTDMVRSGVAAVAAKTGRTEQEALADFLKGNPQKRLIDPQEVARVVSWLCEPGSDGITGQSIVVAGGEVMH